MRCELHGLERSPDGACVLCAKEAARERDRAWIVVTLGAFFFVAIAVVAIAVVRHRPPLAAAPPPPRPNPVVPIAPATTTATAAAPFEPQPLPQESLDLAAARSAVSITIYTATWCGYCKQAKAYMTAHDMSFVERDVDASEENARAMRKISPGGKIPAFDVDGETWVGWSSANLESAVDRAAKRRVAKP